MPNEPISATRGWMLARVLVLLSVLVFGCFLWISCCRENSVTTRIAAAFAAVFSLAVPALILYVGARRYYRTGSWEISHDERSAWQKRHANARVSFLNRFVLPILTIILGFFNLVAAGINIHRHNLSFGRGLHFLVWLFFTMAFSFRLYTELKKPTGATSEEPLSILPTP